MMPATLHLCLLPLLLLALSGCGSIPLTSIIKLSQLDPLTADAEQIRAAVRLPDTVRVKPGGAVMVLSARRETIGESLSDRFVLERVSASADQDRVGLEYEDSPGFRIDIFRIAKPDLPRLASLRQRIIAWKQQDPDGAKGSLSIGIEGCRVGPVTDDELPVSTYLRTDDEDAFLTLTRNIDLRTLQDVIKLPPCD